jgi:hypothetical protein
MNLLVNHSFEATPNYAETWNKLEKFTAERSPDGVDGEASLKVVVKAEDDLDIYQAVTVQPGGTYELAGMIKTEALEGPVQLEVRDLKRGWRGFLHSGEPITGTNDWTYLTTTFTVPAQTEVLAVFLRRPLSGTSGSGTLWFDNYRLTPARTP